MLRERSAWERSLGGGRGSDAVRGRGGLREQLEGPLEARECDCGRHECEPGYLFLGSPLEWGGLRGVAPCARAILRGVAGRRGRGLVLGGCACARLERFSFCTVAASSADGCRVARAW